MDLQACTEALRTKVGADAGLNATLKFDCGDVGIVYIDGRADTGMGGAVDHQVPDLLRLEQVVDHILRDRGVDAYLPEVDSIEVDHHVCSCTK